MPWFLAVSIILAGICALISRSVSQLVSSSGWVAHSYRMLDTLDLTENAFTHAQSDERGYVATCKLSLLSPFRGDLPRVFSYVAELKFLTADNPAQHARVVALSDAVMRELDRMSSVVAVNLKGQQQKAETMLVDDQNVRGTHAVLSMIETLENEERAILASRLKEVTFFAWLSLGACLLGALACFAILAFVFWLIRRETRRRETTEASLQQSNLRLEGSLGELQQHNASARAVSVLGELLQTCRSAEEALAISARHLTQLLPGMSGAIYLLSPARDRMDAAARIGADDVAGAEFSADDCWGLRLSRAHLCVRGSSEPRCAHSTGRATDTICVPMLAHGDVLGVVSIEAARPLGFSELHCQTIQTIVEQLALAVANLRLRESLRNQSLRDVLTGLFNRRYLEDALPREIGSARRHGRPLAIAMVDIDHFKKFNDTFGHEGGDALLAAFGQLLGQHHRAEDVVCRYGGEEFAVLLPDTNLASACERIDALRQAVKRLQVNLDGKPLGPVTMSAGVAVFPQHGDNGRAVIGLADAALYDAKKSGRDRVCAADVADSGLDRLPAAG